MALPDAAPLVRPAPACPVHIAYNVLYDVAELAQAVGGLVDGRAVRDERGEVEGEGGVARVEEGELGRDLGRNGDASGVEGGGRGVRWRGGHRGHGGGRVWSLSMLRGVLWT